MSNFINFFRTHPNSLKQFFKEHNVFKKGNFTSYYLKIKLPATEIYCFVEVGPKALMKFPLLIFYCFYSYCLGQLEHWNI